MKNSNALQLIFLSIIIIQTISSADTQEDIDIYQNMSFEELKKQQRKYVQQNITDQLKWIEEKQIETCCGICCSLIMPVTLCGCVGYHLNKDIGIPIGTLIGACFASKTASAFSDWYQPDHNGNMTELRKIQNAIEKKKEKID